MLIKFKKKGYNYYDFPKNKANFIRNKTKGYRGINNFFERLGLRFLTRDRKYLDLSIEGLFNFLDPSVIPFLNIDRQSDRPIENIINLLRNALIKEGYTPNSSKSEKNQVIENIYRKYGSFESFFQHYGIPSTFRNRGYNLHIIDLLTTIDSDFSIRPEWQRNQLAQKQGYEFQQIAYLFLKICLKILAWRF